jgi:cytochrome P450
VEFHTSTIISDGNGDASAHVSTTHDPFYRSATTDTRTRLSILLVYKQLNTSIVSTVAFLDNRTTYSVSSPRACRILNADRKRFQKPVALYEILKVFGSNVVVTEGEEWRRHRKVSRDAGWKWFVARAGW